MTFNIIFSQNVSYVSPFLAIIMKNIFNKRYSTTNYVTRLKYIKDHNLQFCQIFLILNLISHPWKLESWSYEKGIQQRDRRKHEGKYGWLKLWVCISEALWRCAAIAVIPWDNWKMIAMKGCSHEPRILSLILCPLCALTGTVFKAEYDCLIFTYARRMCAIL